MPVEKTVGETVMTATINTNGTFRFRATKVGNDTTLAQIIRLVDEAGSTKAPLPGWRTKSPVCSCRWSLSLP